MPVSASLSAPLPAVPPISPLLQRAINDKHAQVVPDGKRWRITYAAVNVSENYNDPEEQVRADFWAELIYKYDYEPRKIGVEVTIPDRVPSDRADLVIYRDDERKRPYAVVECKRDDISDAEYNQAIEQAFGNGTFAKLRLDFVMVVAGRTRTVYDATDKFGIGERSLNIIADLPRAFGKPVDFKFTKGGVIDISPVHPFELTRAIRKCHQTLWGGGKLSPTAAFGELCKIIFVKINDEKAKRKLHEPYQFQVKTHEAAPSLTRRVKALYAEHRVKDPEVFNEDIRVGDDPLSLVVRHLESISLSATDLDVKGQAFQEFMGKFFKGDAGQFYTPIPLVKFAVAMIAPTSDERVLDPPAVRAAFCWAR